MKIDYIDFKINTTPAGEREREAGRDETTNYIINERNKLV